MVATENFLVQTNEGSETKSRQAYPVIDPFREVIQTQDDIREVLPGALATVETNKAALEWRP